MTDDLRRFREVDKKIKFMSTGDNSESPPIHSKSDNRQVMIGSDAHH